jgi:hypothetical protein
VQFLVRRKFAEEAVTLRRAVAFAHVRAVAFSWVLELDPADEEGGAVPASADGSEAPRSGAWRGSGEIGEVGVASSQD